jgi:hypothetical protein
MECWTVLVLTQIDLFEKEYKSKISFTTGRFRIENTLNLVVVATMKSMDGDSTTSLAAATVVSYSIY